MNGKNGNWLKIASLTAVGGLIITVITILGFAGGAVDERIEVQILAHEKDTEAVYHGQISDIQKDIAVMRERQDQIKVDIEEQKIQSQKNFEELKALIRSQ